MKAVSKATVILGLVVLASCSTPLVTTQFDKANLSGDAQTYQLVPATEDLIESMNPSHKQQLEMAMHLELEKLNMFPSENADITVYYFLKVEDHQDVNTWTRYYGRWNRLAVTEVNIHEYEKGTLMVNLVDNHTQEIIWQGSVSGKADQPKAKMGMKITKAINAIFTKYAKQTLKANS